MIQQSCQLRKQDWVPTRTFCSAHPIEKAASSVPLWLGKQQAPKSAREQQTRHVLPPSQTCGGEEERDSTQRITEYPHLGYRDPQGPSKPNSWLHVGSLRIETLCLRALSKHCLSSGTQGCAHRPMQPVPFPLPSGAEPFLNASKDSSKPPPSYLLIDLPPFLPSHHQHTLHHEAAVRIHLPSHSTRREGGR